MVFKCKKVPAELKLKVPMKIKLKGPVGLKLKVPAELKVELKMSRKIAAELKFGRGTLGWWGPQDQVQKGQQN